MQVKTLQGTTCPTIAHIHASHIVLYLLPLMWIDSLHGLNFHWFVPMKFSWENFHGVVCMFNTLKQCQCTKPQNVHGEVRMHKALLWGHAVLNAFSRSNEIRFVRIKFSWNFILSHATIILMELCKTYTLADTICML